MTHKSKAEAAAHAKRYRAQQRRRERLATVTDAALNAAIDAIERDGPDADIRAAVRAVLRKDDPSYEHRERDEQWREMPIDAFPTLQDEGWTREKQQAFLQHLGATGCVSHACAHVGMSRQSAYTLRRRSPNSIFAIGWELAIDMARQKLLDEATERALEGRKTQIWYRGEPVGTRVVHNDRLLMFLLRQPRERLHPVLNAREMEHLFPAMLRMVDTVLPPPISADRIQEMRGGKQDEDEEFLDV